MKVTRETAIFMGLALEIVGLIIGGVVIGGKVDEYYNLDGTGLLGGIVLALCAWFMHVFQAMKRLEKMDEDQQP